MTEIMKATHEVTISQAAFIKAAKPTYRGRAKPKRSVTVFVPKDTQISAEGGQLVIETPNLCTLIPMTGHCTVRISVDPGLLARSRRGFPRRETIVRSGQSRGRRQCCAQGADWLMSLIAWLWSIAWLRWFASIHMDSPLSKGAFHGNFRERGSRLTFLGLAAPIPELHRRAPCLCRWPNNDPGGVVTQGLLQ